MAEKHRCETCNRNFKDKDGFDMHNSAKHSDKSNKKSPKINYRKIKKYSVSIIVISLIVLGIFWMFSSIKTLPPTDMQGHAEKNPPSHILKEPMPLAIQKHMLEHADGVKGGRGGIIINYNCKDYNCESDLIENLEQFGYEFDYVYVAPFKNMDAKIALTKLNKIEILEEYNEEKIRSFI